MAGVNEDLLLPCPRLFPSVMCPMPKDGDGMRYAHTWRSRRVKRWIGMIVLAVAVVFVVSVATSSSKKSENLPNLEAEYC